MKFYKAFKMKTDSTAEGGFRFSLCSVECYEENGEFVDVEVECKDGGVVDEVIKRDGVELEVYATAKRCLENATVCGYPYFYKVTVPEDAVIDEYPERGYTVVKELRFVRELSFDDMVAIAAKEANEAARCEAEPECGDVEGSSEQVSAGERMQHAYELGQRAGELVVKCLSKYDELIEIEQDLEKRQEAFETEKANAAIARRREQEYRERLERECKRLRVDVFERKRLFPFWMSAMGIFGAVIGYFIGIIVGAIF